MTGSRRAQRTRTGPQWRALRKRICKAKGWTVRQFAEALGYEGLNPQGSVYQVEQGVKTYGKLARERVERLEGEL